MAITFDNATLYPGIVNHQTDNPQTFSHTVGVGSNGFLMVASLYNAQAGAGVTSVTFNGVNASSLASASLVTGLVLEIWGLVTPASGAHNVVVSFGAGYQSEIGFIAASYFGVNQTTPLDAIAAAGDVPNATDITNTVTTIANNAWLATVFVSRGTHVTFTAVHGTIRVQGDGSPNFTYSLAHVDRGPLSPPGSFSTEVTSSAMTNLDAFGISIAPVAATTGNFFLVM